MPLDSISYDNVENYIASKLAEDDPLSPRTINMTLVLLAAILETAVERDLITRNPAKGKSRRLRERTPTRSYLETPEQIEALLAAASDLDREAASNRRHVHRHATLATLTFAGLRISELCSLRWRDVDLAHELADRSRVQDRRRYAQSQDPGSATHRTRLRDVAERDRTRRLCEPDAYVFPTSEGRRMSAENFRNRVLATAIKRADKTAS